MTYDSKYDTQKHIDSVRENLAECWSNLIIRALEHDYSKTQEPEKSIFDEFKPKLKNSIYGSDEYKKFLVDMGEALKHHYEVNSHHPEHYENGINGMSLFDLVEMLADWKASAMTPETMKINKERFGVSDQLYEIFQNTIKEMKW